MKYLTKEWYNLCQNQLCHLEFKSNKKASEFSEKFFQKLYDKELKSSLKLNKNVSELEKQHLKENEELKFPYDEKEYTKLFKYNNKYQIKYLNENLPQEILDNVADIRVLALGVSTIEVKRQIRNFQKQHDKKVDEMVNPYCKYYNKIEKNIPEHMKGDNGINFHDCYIERLYKKNNDLIMVLDNSGGFTQVEKVIFKNAEILEKEKGVRGGWWLYDEFYISDDGYYELHALLQSHKHKLIYLTLKFKDIQFTINKD